MTAARYVALNPVRARLVKRAEDWRGSSGAAHLAARDDGLVSVAPAPPPLRQPLRPDDEQAIAKALARQGDSLGGSRGALRNSNSATRLGRRTNGTAYSEILARAASSPTMPRRKASTQATKTTPWMTVTHSPNWAR